LRCTCSNSFDRQGLITLGCGVSERNSRSSSRGQGQSPKSSPAKLLMKACPCCVESSPTVRKRLADHLTDDAESTGVDCKRARRGLDAGRRLSRSSRSCVTQITEVGDLAREIHRTFVTPSGSNVPAEVVKRGRGRPRKVSCLCSLLASVGNEYIRWSKKPRSLHLPAHVI